MQAELKGSIQEVPLKSGDISYKASIDLPGANGSRDRETKTFSSRDEANQWLIEMNVMLVNGNGSTFQNTGMLLGEYLEIWFNNHTNGLKQSTVSKYRYHLDTMIPELGEIILSELTPHHVQTFYDKKTDEGLSTTTTRGFGKTLRMALDHAVQRGMIEQNPTRIIKLPPVDKKEMKYLTSDQVDRFLNEIGDHWPYRGLFQLAITTGMRRGELLGLKWADIDFDNARLKVRRQLLRKWEYGFYFEDPKTDKSRRTIEIPEKTLAVLEQHRERQQAFKEKKDEWEYPELVFTSQSGTILMPRNIRKNMKKHLKAADCPVVRFHDLRHTFATLLVSQDVNIMVVSKQLGHAKPSITWDRYSHVAPDMERKTATKMDQLLD